ncbi:hypothetical protein EXIGLDRAFT_640869, partial [Exidia glandulosa HHB12029]
VAVLAAVTTVVGHGVVTSPTPRALGSAAQSACGTGVYTVLNATDKYGPIENAQKKIDSSYNATACHLFFCRGYQFSDNKSNVKTYPAGTSVAFHVDLEAHHTGYANVSVVDLSKQKIIGTPLKTWSVYANDSLGPADWPPDETDFTVTVPNLSGACATAGACAIQWFWWAYNGQTYESCIDFTQA